MHGRRCTNPHSGNATGLCVLHDRRVQKPDDGEVKAVAEKLLANNVELLTKEDVNRITSQLLTLVAQKRISRQDGSLLAYIASVLLQTITPVKKESLRDQDMEFIESPAASLREERLTFNRNVAAPITLEVPMPGRSNNPYMYPTKWK
jgi:hypothetical protein